MQIAAIHEPICEDDAPDRSAAEKTTAIELVIPTSTATRPLDNAFNANRNRLMMFDGAGAADARPATIVTR